MFTKILSKKNSLYNIL